MQGGVKNQGHNLSLLQTLTNYLNRDVSIANSRASINIKHKKAEVLIHVWNIQKSKENNITNTHVLTFSN